MKKNLSKEEKEQLEKILESLGESLDITKTQYDNLVKSYNAVGEFLINDPNLAPYHPVVSPQGSLRLGTIIQPVNIKDDLDIDLVYRLMDKDPDWTQKDIKERVGSRLKSSARYSDMVQSKEGRRCWTLNYRDRAENPKEKYHMDILPCVANKNYNKDVEKMMEGEFSLHGVKASVIYITDRYKENYKTSTCMYDWLNSNPDGYAFWFASRCNSVQNASLRLSSIQDVIPIGKYMIKKLPLQRIVQILKRHRDYMFAHDTEDKPISIIITTLASEAYAGEANILEGLVNVTENMENYIERDKYGNCKISNPVDPDENFADKWIEKPQRKIKFFKWLEKVKRDVRDIVYSGDSNWQKQIGDNFGQDVLNRTNSIYADKVKKAISAGSLMMGKSGTMGAVGRMINNANTFFGDED